MTLEERQNATEQSKGPEAKAASGDTIVTLRVRRAHIVGTILFLAGVLVGLLSYRLLDKPDFVTLPSLLDDEVIGDRSADAAVGASNASIPVATDDRPAFGPPDAPVTVVEFLDYQCPFCERHFREVLPLLRDEYEDRMRYVVRNFPLPQLHPFAMDAAIAAECAFEQDNFLVYHDILFEHQAQVNDRSFVRFAQELQLDVEEFRMCLKDPEVADVVNRDISEGRSYGVTATPTFFINGRLLTGAQPISTFRDVIEEELERTGENG